MSAESQNNFPAAIENSYLETEVKSDVIHFKQYGSILEVSLKCPEFIIDGEIYGSNIIPTTVIGDLSSDKPLEAVFEKIALINKAYIDVVLYLKWFPEENILRKWAIYKTDGTSSVKLLEEVILEKMEQICNTTGFLDPIPGESHPGFSKGFFAGIEFPYTSTRVEDRKLILAHRPGLRLQPGVWYETRKAVYGLSPEGQEKNAFYKYIHSHSVKPRKFHINYNSWYTSPVPYSENDILNIMGTFKKEMYDTNKVSFDT